ncbi:MAG: ABC transporter ATP-binding protein [Clostridiales bacterium]|nr:ABC transporter ATP-binding protein [Clostridiales bacterium]
MANNLEAQKLSYHPSSAKSPILTEVSYNFEEGHMTALLGPNGSGKTTMLRHFLAQIKSTAGAALIGEKDALTYAPKERSRTIAWVPQNSSGESAFNVEEVVLMARYPYKSTWEADSEEDFRIAEEAMRTVGVYEFRNREFGSLSGGERQRVLIARALAQTTQWVLLDEPTSNLDIKYQIEIMKLMRGRVDEGKSSCVVVMHDFNMVEKYCDRVAMLKNGQLVASGDTREVLTPKLLREVYEVSFEVLEKDGQRFFVPRTEN